MKSPLPTVLPKANLISLAFFFLRGSGYYHDYISGPWLLSPGVSCMFPWVTQEGKGGGNGGGYNPDTWVSEGGGGGGGGRGGGTIRKPGLDRPTPTPHPPSLNNISHQ